MNVHKYSPESAILNMQHVANKAIAETVDWQIQADLGISRLGDPCLCLNGLNAEMVRVVASYNICQLMKQTDHQVVGDGGYEFGQADQEHNRLSTRFDENAS